MLGRVKWTPDVFYRATIEDTWFAISGHFKERTDDERIFRRLGMMAVSPYVDKKFDIYKHWPIAGDEEIKQGAKKHQKERMHQRLRELKLRDIKKQHGG